MIHWCRHTSFPVIRYGERITNPYNSVVNCIQTSINISTGGAINRKSIFCFCTYYFTVNEVKADSVSPKRYLNEPLRFKDFLHFFMQM